MAEYTLGELREKVIEQDSSRKHPPSFRVDDSEVASVITLKSCPNPKEFKKLESLFKKGDRLVEFKNDDWWVGYDYGSDDAERAFCLVRSDRIVKSILIWSFDE